MTIKLIGDVAVINSDIPVITNGQAALDLIASINYTHNVRKLAINKANVTEDFFRLSTGLAGEIAQKFVNYHFTVAIIGDFSSYTSEPLQDYIYECNKGGHLYFVADEAEALRRLEENS